MLSQKRKKLKDKHQSGGAGVREECPPLSDCRLSLISCLYETIFELLIVGGFEGRGLVLTNST